MGTKNTLADLNNHLFEQLERLNDDDLTGEKLQEERERAKSMASIAQTIINNGELALKAVKHYDEYGKKEKMPNILQIGDGKYILDKDKLIICQSNARNKELKELFPKAIINPLGEWTGGTDVDTGATNRKLGSDMGEAVTGGGLHGKDLSKADVSVNIYAFLKAQETKKPVELYCAIGDEFVDGKPYSEIVEIARKFIKSKGGFEKFAEWGLF